MIVLIASVVGAALLNVAPFTSPTVALIGVALLAPLSLRAFADLARAS